MVVFKGELLLKEISELLLPQGRYLLTGTTTKTSKLYEIQLVRSCQSTNAAVTLGIVNQGPHFNARFSTFLLSSLRVEYQDCCFVGAMFEKSSNVDISGWWRRVTKVLVS